MIGNSESTNSRSTGSSASRGRFGRARSSFSRTFCSASFMSIPVPNSATTLEYPSTEVELSTCRSAMLFTSSSITRVTSVSMSPGATPG
jgi:hypothetical protein